MEGNRSKKKFIMACRLRRPGRSKLQLLVDTLTFPASAMAVSDMTSFLREGFSGTLRIPHVFPRHTLSAPKRLCCQIMSYILLVKNLSIVAYSFEPILAGIEKVVLEMWLSYG